MRSFAILSGPESEELYRESLKTREIVFTISEVLESDCAAESTEVRVRYLRGTTWPNGASFFAIMNLDGEDVVVQVGYSWEKRSGLLTTTEQQLPGRRSSR